MAPLFDAEHAVPATDHVRINGREHLDAGITLFLICDPDVMIHWLAPIALPAKTAATTATPSVMRFLFML
jgi:hypothetical protein